MRYAYDTEFLEDGRTIELISIGMVREDGAEFYAVNRDAPWKRIYKHEWLCANVIRHLPRIHGDRRNHVPRRNPYALDFDHPTMKTRRQIADELLAFIGDDAAVELWADYGAYDHVVLMQLWGPMVDKPAVLPYFTCDYQQARRGVTLDEPANRGNAHNALDDARHLHECLTALFGSDSLTSG